jgi:hypothetical protein
MHFRGQLSIVPCIHRPLKCPKSRLLYNWLFIASNPLRPTTRKFSTEPLRLLYLCHLWREDEFVSYEYDWTFIRCTFCTNSMLLKILPFALHTTTSFAEQIMPILRILCHNSSLVTWMVVSLTTAKFKPLIFSMSGFILSYIVNMFNLFVPHRKCIMSMLQRQSINAIQGNNLCLL